MFIYLSFYLSMYLCIHLIYSLMYLAIYLSINFIYLFMYILYIYFYIDLFIYISTYIYVGRNARGFDHITASPPSSPDESLSRDRKLEIKTLNLATPTASSFVSPLHLVNAILDIYLSIYLSFNKFLIYLH